MTDQKQKNKIILLQEISQSGSWSSNMTPFIPEKDQKDPKFRYISENWFSISLRRKLKIKENFLWNDERF